MEMAAMASATATATDLLTQCTELARRARAAARRLVVTSSNAKDSWLQATADALDDRASELLDANALDVADAERAGLTSAQVDRLRLNSQRLAGAAAALREVANLPDPVGQIRESRVRPNGLAVHKVGVPLGVIFFIYESRPNVTLDAAALCVKSGNAVILRGGKEAAHSNKALHRIIAGCLAETGLPVDAVQLVDTPDRAAVGHLLGMPEYIDLAIPRGGEALIRRVAEEARMPVLKHYQGNCHVYVEKTADPAKAEAIVVNSKCQRPGVCNAAESLLVDAAVAPVFLPRVAAALLARGVELRGCPATRALVSAVKPATDEDFAAEYLDLIMSVKIVSGVDEAILHINRYGSGHTDAIVTNDLSAARLFASSVDSAAVLVNASTRFNDGFELGLGAEIGISTDKFHARGPCGLLELTGYKYVIYGDGQIRG
jgi:glutamate-5-semialdehyde dehydrogenase